VKACRPFRLWFSLLLGVVMFGSLSRSAKVFPVAAALVAGLSAAPSWAVTVTELEAALGGASALMATNEARLLAIGTVIIGLAVIAAGIKWIKGTLFS
jgi:hypothetical protein